MKAQHALALADAAAEAVDDASASSAGLRPAVAASDVEEHHVCARAVATLALVNGAHFYTICSLFPYAGFLAVDNGWAESVDAAGYVAGYLATATLLARIPTSVAWGYVADRWGWYPAVQVSLASLAVGSLAFGAAQPLWAALLSRCVFFGALNGWPALTGLVCGEVGGEAAQARVLSRVIGAGPIFALIGPAVGGWTYKLVPWLPPALPPNLVGAALSLFTMVAAHINLRNVRRPPAAAAVAPAKAGGELSPGEEPVEKPAAWANASPAPRSPLRSPELLLVIFFRAVTGLVMFLVWDVFPLFCIASRGAGGLALSSSELGTLLAAAALLQAAYMLGLSGRVIARLGVARVVLLVSGVQSASLALLSLSQQAPVGVLALLYALNACCNATSLVVAIAATNVVGARHPRRKGTIQGVATSVESLAKAAGPVLGASLFALALDSGGARLFFDALALCIALTYALVGWAFCFSSLEKNNSLADAAPCRSSTRGSPAAERSAESSAARGRSGAGAAHRPRRGSAAGGSGEPAAGTGGGSRMSTLRGGGRGGDDGDEGVGVDPAPFQVSS